MNTNNVRSKVQKAIKRDERTGDLARQIAEYSSNSGAALPPLQQKAIVQFCYDYIKETPDLLDAVAAAASKTNAHAGVQAMLNVALHYWSVRDDLISDQSGLIGLVDDAYLSRHFVEVASDTYGQQSGRPLLALDLGPANRAMRNLLGEPVASQLDAIVGQTMAAQAMQSTLQQLLGDGGAFPLMMPGSFGGSSYADISREADIRLGAMGGPLPY